MRMMLKFTVPVEAGNRGFTDGSLAKTVATLTDALKPEAAYFGPYGGQRSGMMFFDMAEPAQLVEIAEPLFLGLNADVEIVPVMNGDDLRKGFQKAGRK